MVSAAPSPAIVLRGLRLQADDAVTEDLTVVGIDDENVIPRLLADLQSADGRQRLANDRIVAQEEDPAALWQPIHRRFQVVLAEAVCDGPGHVPACRRSIDSAGVLVRRRGGAGLEGWMNLAGEGLGWQTAVTEIDPDSARREAGLDPNQQRLRRLGLEQQDNGISEQVTPLFIAPPEVNDAVGTTVLYGLLTVNSTQLNRRRPVPEELTLDFARTLLPQWLRSQPKSPLSVLGRRVRADDDDAAASNFRRDLRTMMQVAGLATDAGDPLRQHLNQRRLPDSNEALGDFIARSYAVLINKDASQADAGGGVVVPDEWVSISADHQADSGRLIHEALTTRWQDVAPAESRFGAPEDLFELSAFCRIKDPCACPDHLSWTSRNAGPFRIMPWYEHSGAPPHLIDLPDVGQGDDLKKFKPNVAFALAPGMQELLEKLNLDKLMEGEAPEKGTGIGILWICGFNIPLITICAFIVLYIFLNLLNIVFWWLFYIKICIPIPIPTEEE